MGNGTSSKQHGLLRGERDTSNSGPLSDLNSEFRPNNNFRRNDNLPRLQAAQNYQSDFELPVDVAIQKFYNYRREAVLVVRRGDYCSYFDPEEKCWKEFSEDVMGKGIFVDETPSDEEVKNLQLPARFFEPQTITHDFHQRGVRTKDDREGFIDHSKRGRLLTYAFEHRMHVQFYYDIKEHTWIKLPVSWELKLEFIKNLVDEVQSQCRDWTDREDILVCLRASNYNVDDCVETYKVAKYWLDSIPTGRTNNPQGNQPKKQNGNQTRQNNGKNGAQKPGNQSSSVGNLKLQLGEANTGRKNLQAEDTARSTADNGNQQGRGVGTTSQEQDLQRTIKQLREENSILKQRLQREQEKNKQAATNEETELLLAKLKQEIKQQQLLRSKPIRGNIHVFCRCRRIMTQGDPAGEEGEEDEPVGKPGSHLDFLSETEIEVQAKGFRHVYRLNRVFGPNSSQEDVYTEISPFIKSCADGYNVCIMAYGQTGSGKTFTMEGTNDNRGIGVRAITEMLNIFQNSREKKYTLKLSAVEIYNDNIRDLLNIRDTALEIRRNKRPPGLLDDLTEFDVNNQTDVERQMNLARQNRKVAGTTSNSRSSRSHLIVCLRAIEEDKLTKITNDSYLLLCDLAGTERLSKSEMVEEQRKVETIAINKSLSALRQIFQELKTGQQFIAYRNSKLTLLLQPCLSGDAKVVMVTTINPDVAQVQETVNTLQFASDCCQIVLKQNFV